MALATKINYRVILLIIAAAISYQVVLETGIDDPDVFDIVDVIYLLFPLSVGIACFLVSLEYKKMQILFFSKPYFILGIAFIFWFAGDTIYSFYNYVLEEDPYPLLEADVLFILYYAALLYFLIHNIRFFKLSIELKSFLTTAVIVIAIVISYSFLAYGNMQEWNFDFYYGLIFVVSSSVCFAFAIEGIRIFQSSTFKEAWLLLIIGISLLTIADVWYYYEEFIDGFDELHPLNTIWLGSVLLIIYSLIKHKQSME